MGRELRNKDFSLGHVNSEEPNGTSKQSGPIGLCLHWLEAQGTSLDRELRSDSIHVQVIPRVIERGLGSPGEGVQGDHEVGVES